MSTLSTLSPPASSGRAYVAPGKRNNNRRHQTGNCFKATSAPAKVVRARAAAPDAGDTELFPTLSIAPTIAAAPTKWSWSAAQEAAAAAKPVEQSTECVDITIKSYPRNNAVQRIDQRRAAAVLTTMCERWDEQRRAHDIQTDYRDQYHYIHETSDIDYDRSYNDQSSEASYDSADEEYYSDEDYY